MLIEWNPRLWIALASLFIALSTGSVVRLVGLRKKPIEAASDRRHSLGVWWVLASLLAVSLIVGEVGVAILLGVAGTLGMREYGRMLAALSQTPGSPTAPANARPAWSNRWSCISIIVLGWGLFSLIVAGQTALAMTLFPVVSLLLLSVLQMVGRKTRGLIEATAGTFAGGMLIFYTLAHGLLAFHTGDLHGNVGPACLLLYVVVLTETNDIAQALLGRIFGRHRVAPVISPHKTWEGLGGGLAVTSLVAVALAPWLTNLTQAVSWPVGLLIAALSGLSIGLSGYAGDLNMSVLKRQAGVKDSSHLLPGMGGMIDRIDSLTFSIPTHYYFAWAVHTLVQ